MRENGYLDVYRRVSEIFPQTTDFDYRILEPGELWQKVQDLLCDLGIFHHLSPDDRQSLYTLIMTKQKILYHKQTAIIGHSPSPSFDQNNQFIKDSVLHMKNRVMHIIKNYIYVDVDYGVDELESLVNDQAGITDFITKSLIITKEEDDLYRIDSLMMKIATDISNYYGISDPMKVYHFLETRMSKIINIATSVRGNRHEEDMLVYYDYISQDQNRFQEFLPEVVLEVVRFVSGDLKCRLMNKKEEQRWKEDDIEMLLESEEENIAENTPAASDDVGANYDQLLERCNEIDVLNKRQREIIEELQKLDAQKKNLLIELDQIEKKIGTSI